MASTPTSNSRRFRDPTRIARFWRYFFAFTVAALAVFLVAIGWSANIPATYTATAVVWAADTAASPASSIKLKDVRDELVRRDQLAELARRLAPLRPTGAPNLDEQIDQIIRSIRLAPAGQSELGEMAVAISCTDEQPFRAAALANALAHILVTTPNGSAERRQAAAARRAADEAGLAVQTARQQLAAFHQHEVGADQLHRAGSPPVMEPTDPLRRNLAKLKQQRDMMLTTMLPAHPLVQEIETDIADLEQQLRSMPDSGRPTYAPDEDEREGDLLIADDPSRLDEGDISVPQVAAAAALGATDRTAQPLLRRYHELVEALNVAMRNYDEREQAARSAQERLRSVPSGPVWSRVDRADVPRRADQSLPTLVAILGSCTALFVGAATVIATGIGEATLSSAEQLEKWTGTPVMGSISATSRATWSSARWARRAAKTVVRLSELLVVATALWFGWLAISQEGFTQAFWKDPWRTFTSAVQLLQGSIVW